VAREELIESLAGLALFSDLSDPGPEAIADPQRDQRNDFRGPAYEREVAALL
jgi:hypothetical protein